MYVKSNPIIQYEDSSCLFLPSFEELVFIKFGLFVGQKIETIFRLKK